MAINERAMLVKLSISQWYNRKTDRRVAEEVANKYGVDEHNDRYIKTLLPAVSMRQLLSSIADLRAFHNNNTMPWQDGNVRILPATNFFAYRQGIAARTAEFEASVDRFCAAYPAWVDNARNSKKGLFDERDYPSAQFIRSQFSATMSMLPFPSANDFRIEGSADMLKEIKASTEAAVTEALAEANKQLVERLYARAYPLYVALNDPEKVFRDNTVTSLGETAELVALLNVTNDPKVDRAVAATRAITTRITPERLRASSTFRNEIAVEVAALLTAYKEQ